MVAQTITVTAFRDLDELNHRVHDEWIGIDDVVLDAGELVFPMLITDEDPFESSDEGSEPTETYHRRKALLKISNVLDYQIQANAHGGNDVNVVCILSDKVIITLGYSGTIEARVSSAHISLEIADEIFDDVVETFYEGGGSSTHRRDP